jgi:hypothetical protein
LIQYENEENFSIERIDIEIDDEQEETNLDSPLEVRLSNKDFERYTAAATFADHVYKKLRLKVITEYSKPPVPNFHKNNKEK